MAVHAWRAGPVVAPDAPGAAVAGAGLALTGFLASLLFAAGAGDRASAVSATMAMTLLILAGLAAPGPGGAAVAGVLLAHLGTPPAPYGSWAARGRPDPPAWSPDRGWWHAVWTVLTLAQAAAVLRAFGGVPAALRTPGGVVDAALAITLAAALVLPRLRPAAFAAMALVHAGRLALAPFFGPGFEPGVSSAAFLAALPFALDPAWIPGRRGGTPALLFYDGDCGLCHRAVRFVVAEDPDGAAFRFAPLASGLFAQRLEEARRRALPDSLVVLAADGRVLTRSAAVLFILAALGGWWRVLAGVGAIVPRALGDALYDRVAAVRRRWFAAQAGACPVIAPGLRARFFLDPR
jgi:predicted DCC family thiol-disulfide oxidoreductase YuxK